MYISLTLVAFILILAAIGSFIILRSARKIIRQNPSTPPSLPGVWPSSVQRKYRGLDDAGKKLWWHRNNFVNLYVVMPLMFVILVSFLMIQFSVMLSCVFLLFLAVLYSWSGGN